jgi:hypothetical protein
MTHHPKAEKENYNNIYYTVGLLTGLFVGVIIGVSPLWILVSGVIGLLFTAFFVQVLAKSSEKA